MVTFLAYEHMYILLSFNEQHLRAAAHECFLHSFIYKVQKYILLQLMYKSTLFYN